MRRVTNLLISLVLPTALTDIKTPPIYFTIYCNALVSIAGIDFYLSPLCVNRDFVKNVVQVFDANRLNSFKLPHFPVNLSSAFD